MLLSCDDLCICRDTSRWRFFHSHTNVSLKIHAWRDVRSKNTISGRWFQTSQMSSFRWIKFVVDVWVLWNCASTRLELNHFVFYQLSFAKAKMFVVVLSVTKFWHLLPENVSFHLRGGCGLSPSHRVHRQDTRDR